MSLSSPLEAVCRSQIATYFQTYQHLFKTAAMSALTLQRWNDLSSTHALLFQFTWNKEAGTSIEEHFSLFHAEVVTNAEYGLWTLGGEDDQTDPTCVLETQAFSGWLEEDMASGTGRSSFDRPPSSTWPLVAASKVLIVVKPTPVGSKMILPIIVRALLHHE